MSGYRFCVNVVTASFLVAAGSAGLSGLVATAAADPGGGSSSSHDSGGSHSSAGGSHGSGSSQRSSGSGASGSTGTSSAQHGGGTSGGNTGTKSSGSADAPGHAAATKPNASSGSHSADSPSAAAKHAGAGGGAPTKEKRALTDPKPGTSNTARTSGIAVGGVGPAQPDHGAAPGAEHKPGGKPASTPPGHATKVGERGSADSNPSHPKHIEGHGEGNAAGAGAAGEHHGDTANGEHAGIKGEQHPSSSTSGGQESHDSGASLSPEQNAATSNPSGEKAIADALVDKGIAVAIAKPSPETIQLEPHDLLAMNDYTEWGYIDLNRALRNGTLDASQQVRVDAIKRALEKLPRHEGPVTRGTFLPLEILARYQPDKNIVEDAFTSTTKNPDATFPGNTYFQIVSKNGRSVESVSAFPEEAEVLFPPSTAFTVLSKMIDPTTDKTVIRMVER
ncbi:ADP-ribosyltransferase domain-containing protein [Mycobacteroides salmoniphilum]|uniref:ADP-ribosyltransferase domain-containing protein n=1 Tax=Mycobacteroides salmoniphilum TaxID=404941 RepID=UPI001065F317|nr:ADP-ribosyltransferase domain-containing protein [Mycobacteroides salmoniphilum]TDZ90638.1 putative NAD(+)--arginine ADP-ribosyltransferase Vis precursor [Mycobacteroides salmoniphilum]